MILQRPLLFALFLHFLLDMLLLVFWCISTRDHSWTIALALPFLPFRFLRRQNQIGSLGLYLLRPIFRRRLVNDRCKST